MHWTIRTLLPVAWGVALVGCGGSKARGEPNAASMTTIDAGPADAGTVATTTADAGEAAAQVSAVDAGDGAPARPFANDALEATNMVNAAIDERSGPLQQCVLAARTRRKAEHGKIVFDIGVDQEGVLIGVKTPKGQRHDPTLNECVRTVLAGAAFPRSHAGVITVRRSFEEQQVPR